MAVHAHPDDESSKGAATMARYVAEGVEVLVVTLHRRRARATCSTRRWSTTPRSCCRHRRDPPRARWTRRARSSASSRPGSASSTPGCPRATRCRRCPRAASRLEPLEDGGRAAGRLIREFRPHVITTYDENGGYPHPDHIMCHKVSRRGVRRSRRPGRGTREAGEPWQPLKLYYNQTLHQGADRRLHEAMLGGGPRVAVRASGSSAGRTRGERPDHHPGAVRRVLRGPRRGAARARHPGRPGRPLVPVRWTMQQRGLADRGLRAGALPRRGRRCPRTTCSPASRPVTGGWSCSAPRRRPRPPPVAAAETDRSPTRSPRRGCWGSWWCSCWPSWSGC